jgi:hypothetical protein
MRLVIAHEVCQLPGASHCIRDDSFDGGNRHLDRDVPGLLIMADHDGCRLRPRLKCRGSSASLASIRYILPSRPVVQT